MFFILFKRTQHAFVFVIDVYAHQARTNARVNDHLCFTLSRYGEYMEAFQHTSLVPEQIV